MGTAPHLLYDGSGADPRQTLKHESSTVAQLGASTGKSHSCVLGLREAQGGAVRVQTAARGSGAQI